MIQNVTHSLTVAKAINQVDFVLFVVGQVMFNHIGVITEQRIIMRMNNMQFCIRSEVSRGDPAHSILGFAEGGDVDLIVMGRRGLGPFEGLLMGSVSSKVTALADCPVLTVK